jgi:ATP-dependent Clp protease protease subunit
VLRLIWAKRGIELFSEESNKMIFSDDTRLADGEKPAANNNAAFLNSQKFLEARSVLIFGEITQKLAQDVAAQLIYLDFVKKEPIKLYINSQGGHVESGDTIHDLVQFIQSTVTIIGTGWVASAGTHIFLSVPKERRLCLPNTRFLIHQPAGGVRGQSTDVQIAAKEILKTRERLARIIAERTGQPYDKVHKDIERDYWMQAEEAVTYGLVGKIISSMSDLAV